MDEAQLLQQAKNALAEGSVGERSLKYLQGGVQILEVEDAHPCYHHVGLAYLHLGFERYEQSFIAFASAALLARDQDDLREDIRFTAALTFLEIGIRHPEEFVRQFYTEAHEKDLCDDFAVLLKIQGYVNASDVRRVPAAHAYGILGMGIIQTHECLGVPCGTIEDGEKFLVMAVEEVCKDGVELSEDEQRLLFHLQVTRAGRKRARNELEESIQLYQESKLLAPNPYWRLYCEVRCCFMTGIIHGYVRAFEMLKSLVSELEGMDTLKGDVYFGLGWCMVNIQNFKQARKYFEAAQGLVQGYYKQNLDHYLFFCYVQEGLYSKAFDLAKSSSVNIQTESGQMFQFSLGRTYRTLSDNEESIQRLTGLLEKIHDDDWKLRCSLLCALGDAYSNLYAKELAINKYDEALQLVQSRSHSEHLFASEVYLSRGSFYRNQAARELAFGTEDPSSLQDMALLDFQHAASILETAKRQTQDLANAYAGQALILSKRHSHADALSLIDKSLELADSLACDLFVKARLRRVRALVLSDQGRFVEAVSEARHAADMLAKMQSEMTLHNLEFAWVTILEGDMKHVSDLLQKLMAGQSRFMEALVWAERSRMRLFSHKTTVDRTLAFDHDDSQAMECINESIKKCGERTVVIEYTYSGAKTELFIYVVTGTSVQFEHVDLVDFFRQVNRWTRLEALISRARSEIQKVQRQKKRDESKAKEAMGALYRIILGPVWKHVQGYETIAFVPDGCMSLIPFAALYDAERDEFLVESKSVCVLPSLRAHRECPRKSPTHAELDCFVAGDPEPMGLGLQQLRGGREEAEMVAEKLGVGAVIGPSMTKETVVEGLSTAEDVVVIISHGVVDNRYPHGAMVMQGQGGIDRVQDEAGFVLVEASSLRSKVNDDQVLTAKEIEKLDVRASLVVLSACQTGEGKVSNEGLLGLGRAVLEAGASCTVVTLWGIDDASTRDLMTGMFGELTDGRTIAQALRLSMVKLLKSERPMYMWAPFIAYGANLQLRNWHESRF